MQKGASMKVNPPPPVVLISNPEMEYFWGAATATLNPTPLWVMIVFPIPAPTRSMAFVMVTVPDQEALPAGTRTVSPSLAELMAA